LNSSELTEAIKLARRTYIIGNGGSYANAMHICNDLLSRGVRAYTLDPATMAAFGNDHGWSRVFARWIDVVGEPGDLLIALSGSGTSPNILYAIEIAERRGMVVERIFGKERGLNMQHAEEQQLTIGHEVWKLLGL
jgi:D-sedoheptulose 7-phosphate isomerase